MSDLIDRQSVIKAVNNMVKESRSDYVKSVLRNIEAIIDDLPSAQPNLQPTCNLASDCISRQAAIRAVCERECQELEPCKGECEAIWALEELPSVQAEPERTMEEFMYGQDMGNPEDGSL